VYIIIVGGGKLGAQLSRALLNAGHEVFVIERDPNKVQFLQQEYGEMAMRGDGAEPDVLTEAGAGRADVLIATTGDDDTNLVACQIAKTLFKVGRTIALANDPGHEALFDALGVDVTVSTTQVVLAEVQEELPERAIVRVMVLRSNIEVLSVEVPDGAQSIGKTLGEITLPEDTKITAVINQDGFPKAVSDETVLDANDQVVALIAADDAEALLEALTREA